MHTAIVLPARLSPGYARGNGMRKIVTGAKIFMPSWLVAAATGMWIGTWHDDNRDGELVLTILPVPAAVAAVMWWRLA